MQELIIILLSLLFSAFFSGMEIAFISSNKLRIEIDKKSKSLSSRIISIFTKNPSRYIATMLVGNNVALVIYGIAIAGILHEPIVELIGRESEVLILIIQTFISTLLILITAEFLPKTLFRINPNGALKIFSAPILFFYVMLYPITIFSIALSNFTMRYILKVRIAHEPGQQVFGKIDLNHLVQEGHKQTDESEADLQDLKIFKNAMELSSLKVRDCMIPRTEIVALEIESPIQQMLESFTQTGLSRILIYRNNIDNMIGYVNSKDMFHDPKHIGNHLKSLPIVPETLRVNKILKTFIKDRKSIALVLDEFGGTSGIITTEDVIEEIFGEIKDEHDTVDLVEEQIDEHSYRFSGRHEIDYLNEFYQLNIPDSEEYETLAGFIIFHYENIPTLNETIIIEPYEMKIIEVSANRIELVELTIKQ
ncbi:hemolysin family protein [Bacteroidota bacterium]